MTDIPLTKIAILDMIKVDLSPRCPNCKAKFNPYPMYSELFEIYQCDKCGYEYKIRRKLIK